MSEENKDLARRSWEMLVNQQNPDAIDEFYTADFVWHEPDQDIQGSEEAKQLSPPSSRPSPTSTSLSRTR
jgi:ketosteroid isomerase-like protein